MLFRHADGEMNRAGISFFRQRIDVRTAGIGIAQHARNFVKRFARRIVPRLAQKFE